MNNSIQFQTLSPAGRWGNKPFFHAKIGTHPSSLVCVKRTRKFYVNQRIEYVDWNDLKGVSKGYIPKWNTGIIWKIEDNRLFIEMI